MPLAPTTPPARPAPFEEAPEYPALPRASRRGIGLCLSGGGFRATLFHLGALRRLDELGILSRPDFRTVAAVSGGSITAAHVATVLARGRVSSSGPIPADAWEREVRAPLRAFTRKNVRTAPLLRRLLPWNLWRSDATVEALVRRYETELTGLRLAELPSRPDFLFLATDMAYGVAWVFSRARIGDYLAGYTAPGPEMTVGRAVSASACFPPLFGPMRTHLDPGSLEGGRAPAGPERDECLRDLRLTDGGNYDNMGLEPVWKSHAVVLVSDAGGLFTSESDRGLFWRIPRYQAIQERQARALRKRWLIASFSTGALDGAYWGVGSAPSRYGPGFDGYTKSLARGVVAEIRTDLDAFSDIEAAVLENHGYLLAEAAIGRHVPDLVTGSPPPAVAPHPGWLAPARSEAAIAEALRDSRRRTLWGRR